MQGRRVPFFPGFPKDVAQPGDYCKVPSGVDPRPGVEWYVVDPTGGAGAIRTAVHNVTEHPDGTITVSPSLVMPSGWHGFLINNEWK